MGEFSGRPSDDPVDLSKIGKMDEGITPAQIKKIAKMADNNDHTGSLMELAKILKMKKEIKILQGITSLHQAYGSMPSELIKLRDFVMDDLLKSAKQKFNTEDYQAVYGSF